MTIPRRVRSAIGLVDGDLVDVKAVGKRIVITPRAKVRSDDDEYTPAQRRVIDTRLAKSDEDIKHGRVYGPFSTHKEFMASLRREGAKLQRRSGADPAGLREAIAAAASELPPPIPAG